MGVAILLLLAPAGRGPRGMGRPVIQSAFEHSFPPMVGLLMIVALALLAWAIPIRRARWKKILYTLAGFSLCWVFAIPPRMMVSFSAVLLVVVMRACLYLQWPGRITVAIAAFGSFIVRVGLSVREFFNHLAAGGRLPPGMRRQGSEEFQGFLLQFSMGSILLFGLVLLFVVLMVGTLITEYQSRQKLAMANQRLRRYSLLVEDQATLQERNRIARELHDSIGHCLTAQSIQLENVSVWFDRNQEKAKGHLETARSLSKEALASVRQSVSKLRQEPLNGLALPEAIRALLQDYEQHTKLPIQAEIEISESVPKETAIALYRLIQESLTNITKHAHAKQVKISLQEIEERYTLTIADDGRGFTLSTNQRGFGLTSMRERTEAVKGTFDIQSSPGAGCRIWVEIPRIGGRL